MSGGGSYMGGVSDEEVTLHHQSHTLYYQPLYTPSLLPFMQFSFRSTALGLHNGVGRLGAIAGNIVFGELVDTSVALPMLLSAGMVLLGTGVAVFIPRMYSKQDQPIVHLCISKMVPKKPR